MLVSRLCPQADSKDLHLDRKTNLNHFRFEPHAKQAIIEELIGAVSKLNGIVEVKNLTRVEASGDPLKIVKKILVNEINQHFGPMGTRYLAQLKKQKDLPSVKAFALNCKETIHDSISEHAAEEFWSAVQSHFD